MRIGSGTFGHVYQARWGDQSCAAKAFFMSESDYHQKTIQSEIAVLQKLRHRHIIQFYRVHEEDSRIYLLMELAEKGSLAKAITKREIARDDWTTKTRLANEIARGLAFIHQEKVLHRDLKSANVLLTRHMEVKLADFGLAKVRSMASAASGAGTTPSVGLSGTLRWVAPELLFDRNRVYTNKSDMYALGMVMWEMAADCTRPFKDQDNDALVALDVVNGRRECLPDDTPAEYREWVERCWDQDPNQRPNASQVVLVHDTPADECATDVDNGTTLEFSFDSTRPIQNLGTFNGSITEVELSTVREVFDGNGRLPMIDYKDKIYDCTAAKDGSTDTLFGQWIDRQVSDTTQRDSVIFQVLTRASVRGDASAQVCLGTMYAQGRGVEQNDAEAVQWYTKAAVHGNAKAQLNLGRMYTKGRGIEQDDVEAARWYTKAAAQGNAQAQFNLGTMYAMGRGVVQNDVGATRWYTKAAVRGNVEAQCNLGTMYYKGRGVVQNDAEAVSWYAKAAAQGNAQAQFNLGTMYATGRGVAQNDVEAVLWIAKAADQGKANAQFNLGVMYENGRGIEQSDVKAFRWYTAAAAQGDADAQLNLGLMYANGRGVKQNDVEAAQWIAKAAAHGDASAQLNLGARYAAGRGIEQNDVEAAQWIAKAAAQGNASAQFSLGAMYYNGRGVEQNVIKAVLWLTKAASQGHLSAAQFVEALQDHPAGL